MILVNLLPDFIYKMLLNLRNAIRHKSIKILNYDQKKDFEINNRKLKELNLDSLYISSTLKDNGVDYNNNRQSWHWHLFAGFSKNLTNLKILEIGTHTGEFTNFLSKIFKDSQIDSIDLHHEDQRFINSYNRQNNEFRSNFLKERNKFIDKKNINFFEMDSIDLLSTFELDTYDIIWLDGDHTNPQVNMDIISSFFLLKKGGIFISDDIFLSNKTKDFKKCQGADGIKLLTDVKKLNTHYIIKRCHPKNAFNKKYISVSIKQ